MTPCNVLNHATKIEEAIKEVNQRTKVKIIEETGVPLLKLLRNATTSKDKPPCSYCAVVGRWVFVEEAMFFINWNVLRQIKGGKGGRMRSKIKR